MDTEDIIDSMDNEEVLDSNTDEQITEEVTAEAAEEALEEAAGDATTEAAEERIGEASEDVAEETIGEASEDVAEEATEEVPAREYTDEEIAPVLEPLEGILFAMGNSVEISKLAAALEVEEGLVAAAAERLKAKYEDDHRGIRINRLEDSFQMCTAPDIYEYLIRIAKQPKKYVLTDVLLESLSIVAYKQPITRAEVEKIRGVDCSHAMNKLVEYGLIEEVGRLDAPGRPILFGTTEDFLRSFGVTSLEELPSLNPVIVDEFRAEAENEISLTLEV